MELQRLSLAGRPFVRGYGAGGFTIGELRYTGSLLLLPDRVLAWRPRDPAALEAADLEPLRPFAGTSASLLVIGTGARANPIPTALRAELRALGLAVEGMATPAACRTWNLLLAEDRRAAALLVAMP